MLEGYLAGERAAFQSICAGLTGEHLARRASPPSTLSLLGLIRHLRSVERIWLRQRVAGEDVDVPFDPEVDFEQGRPEGAAADFASWQEQCRLGDAAVADLDLDHTFDLRGRPMSLRAVYSHLLHEYARHNGHADLLREATDGVTGR